MRVMDHNPASLQIGVVPLMTALTAREWDACAGTDNPFVSYAFLSSLEESGCVGERAGWVPLHIVVRNQAGELVGVAPCYLKSHSQGEYVFDHGWAQAYENAGGSYYPKLQVSVPFTPATGPRLLAKNNDPAIKQALIGGFAFHLDQFRNKGRFPQHGGRGLHLYVRLDNRWDFIEVRHAAIAFGRELERRRPDLVTTAWWKEERGSRLFIDFNQNARDRTIASPYSIRSHPTAPVSTPLDWSEVGEAIDPLSFTPAAVVGRVATIGDPWSTIDDRRHDLTPLLEWYERDAANGLGEMPYPPDYPKMPGEPMRVQPSRARQP